MKPLTLRLWDALGLLPIAEGKTQPVSHYLAILSYPPFERTPTMTDIDMLDDEYVTPAQAAELRKLKAQRDGHVTERLPLWEEMALDPADVAEHRAINGTEGQESEE